MAEPWTDDELAQRCGDLAGKWGIAEEHRAAFVFFVARAVDVGAKAQTGYADCVTAGRLVDDFARLTGGVP